MKAVIRFSTNWQDEIDFHSMIIIDEERGVELMEKLSALKEKSFLPTKTLFFGTNEYDTYTFKEIVSCMKIKTISDKEAKILDPYLCFTEDLILKVFDLIDEWYEEEV